MLLLRACTGGGAPVTLVLLGVTALLRRTIDRHSANRGGGGTVKLDIESELEEDGRWLAEVPQLPGVLAYGATRDEAMARAQVLALRVLAERLEHGESGPESISISVVTA